MSLYFFLYMSVVVGALADTTTCDKSEPSGARLTVVEDACDGTATDSSCTIFICDPGYIGGSLVCNGNGNWTVLDCEGYHKERILICVGYMIENYKRFE